MHVLLEQDRRIVVDMSSINAEMSMLKFRLVPVIESVEARVLLLLSRITAIEGEVGHILRSHVELSGRGRSCAGGYQGEGMGMIYTFQLLQILPGEPSSDADNAPKSTRSRRSATLCKAI